MPESGQRYKIINVQGETAVDLNTSNNWNIHGCEFHGGDNQLWDFHQQEDGNWHIQNAETGGFLAIIDGAAGDDVDAVHWGDPFAWAVFQDEQDDSVWRIGVPDSHYHLDLNDNGNSEPGTPIKVWGAWEGRNQCWRIEEP
ncbi:ricin B lectin domain-containing protein [Coprinopsis sp. MPI-PUGE-AT-0042]|nr:ricin B lectin domain-containing protein [Coprinopsis sp. MPI-PUGE-AT-0042]